MPSYLGLSLADDKPLWMQKKKKKASKVNKMWSEA